MIGLLFYETQQPSGQAGLSLKLKHRIIMSENQKHHVGYNIKVNLIGKSFGLWKVLSEAEPVIKNNGKKARRWICLCDCGKQSIVHQTNLVTGGSTSCGCAKTKALIARSTTHGCAQYGNPSAEYRAWQAMINRCTNPNYEKFHLYGGRGIKVCDRWINSFENFLADMGVRPPDKQTLDRINGNYDPSNCRWASWTEQQNNRVNNFFVEWNGKSQTASQWDRELGFRGGTIAQRINAYKWTIERAMTTPKKERKLNK